MAPMNFTKQKYSTTDIEKTYDYQGGRGGGINWEVEIEIYTVLYVER